MQENNRRDLILIPKSVRAWIDVLLGAFAVCGLILLPVVKMIHLGYACVEDFMVMGVGAIVALSFMLFILRGFRKGYIKEGMFTKPIEAVKNGVKRLLPVVLVLVMCCDAFAMSDLLKEKMKKGRELVQVIKCCSVTIVEHTPNAAEMEASAEKLAKQGYPVPNKGYWEENAKSLPGGARTVYKMAPNWAVYFKLGKDQHEATVEEFEKFLDNFDENDEEQVKDLICAVRDDYAQMSSMEGR